MLSATSQATGSISGSAAADITARQPLRYAAYCYDPESSTYYLSARQYDPSTMQFMTKDPARADGEESAYQYCGGDPVGKVDPSGEALKSVRDLWNNIRYHWSPQWAYKFQNKWLKKIPKGWGKKINLVGNYWLVLWYGKNMVKYTHQARLLVFNYLVNKDRRVYAVGAQYKDSHRGDWYLGLKEYFDVHPDSSVDWFMTQYTREQLRPVSSLMP